MKSPSRRIVQRYGAMVWSLCVRRLGETPEAEDAFQATFLVLVRKAPSLHGPQLLGPWLYGVAYRTALKVRGRRARLAVRETTLPEQPADTSSAEQTEAIWRDLRPVIDEEVNRLPEKYRQPVLLCYLQGLSSEEAAQRLGCAKGTVFSRLSRARDLLRQRLSRRGLGVSAGALAAVLRTNAAAKATPSTALSEATIRMSLSFAAGTAGQALSAPLAALVEGVLRSMFLNKMKLIVVVLLTLGIVGSGAGFVAHRSIAGQPKPKSDRASVQPAGVAANAKEKASESKPKPAPLSRLDEKERLLAWRDKLATPIDFEGHKSPDITLRDLLDDLANRYNLSFILNHKAFQFENIQDVEKTLIAANSPIPPMKANLRTVLKNILAHIPVPSGATYILRRDHVEITTATFLAVDMGIARIQPKRDVLPLICDAFEDTPISQVLQRVAETSGYNVIVDPRVAEKVQSKATAQFNNVPTDTAVRLLANMADLSMVRLDNVFYLTTAVNAKRLREEQAQINGEEATPEPAVDKPSK